MSFAYALGGSDRPLRVSVNGATLVQSLSFPNTGGWGGHKNTTTVHAHLRFGTNTIRLTSIGKSGANVYALSVDQSIANYQRAKVPLSGVDLGTASVNLQACIGRCHSDSQCAAGLACFQRSRGEAIPGPPSAKSAPRSLRRALLMPQINPGSLCRCGKRT